MHSNEFSSIVHEAFGRSSEQSSIADLNADINAIRTLLVVNSDNQRALTDADLVTMIAISAVIADGFDYPDPPGGLYQIRRNIAVFIDEVQDFTEIEILLMGMTTTEDYNQITLAGDRCQRLQSKGAVDYQNLFPFASRARQNEPVFLDHNFRQRRELATLSAGFRSMIQKDSRVDFSREEAKSAVAAYTFSSQEAMAQLILERIRSVSANATIAVIVPYEAEAQSWHAILQDDLAAYHRPALLSHRDDLTRKYEIHFTEVRETKGLEFDVVVVPDIGSFALETEVGRNQLYVAISRPKHALLLGCGQGAMERPEIKSLVENRLIELTKPPVLTH